MITTTANRVKAAGFWCDDATAQTQRALDSIGADWNTEIPIVQGIPLLGLQNTVLAMGAVRPKFKWYVEKALSCYVDYIIGRIEHYMGLSTAVETKLRKLRRAVLQDQEGTRAAEVVYWHKEKFRTSMPEYRMLCETALVLLSEVPLHIRAIHAGKSLLSAVAIIDPDNKLYDELCAALKEQLDEADRLTGKHSTPSKADVQGTGFNVEVSGLQGD